LSDRSFLLLFAKEQMSDCSFFALLKRATKRAIAHFQNERMPNPAANMQI